MNLPPLTVPPTRELPAEYYVRLSDKMRQMLPHFLDSLYEAEQEILGTLVPDTVENECIVTSAIWDTLAAPQEHMSCLCRTRDLLAMVEAMYTQQRDDVLSLEHARMMEGLFNPDLDLDRGPEANDLALLAAGKARAVLFRFLGQLLP